LPRKTYELNAAALEDLATIQLHSRMTETAAITVALRNLAEMMTRNLPVYVARPSDEPEPPTSAPSAARIQPQPMVEKPRAGRRKPPAKARPNSKRSK